MYLFTRAVHVGDISGAYVKKEKREICKYSLQKSTQMQKTRGVEGFQHQSKKSANVA